MKALVKVSWDPDRRVAQSWRRDRRGWFRMGWGFDVGRVAATWRKLGYRVEVVDHGEMTS
ncbi:MAG TPA: hypothetical protein VLE97_09630 [Gaiellaceae bacterium]|nr:hypothetical protein [Gaiellaceae bacterium]